MKIVLPLKKPKPVTPTWPFPSKPPERVFVHVPPKPDKGNFEESPL